MHIHTYCIIVYVFLYYVLITKSDESVAHTNEKLVLENFWRGGRKFINSRSHQLMAFNALKLVDAVRISKDIKT